MVQQTGKMPDRYLYIIELYASWFTISCCRLRCIWSRIILWRAVISAFEIITFEEVEMSMGWGCIDLVLECRCVRLWQWVAWPITHLYLLSKHVAAIQESGTIRFLTELSACQATWSVSVTTFFCENLRRNLFFALLSPKYSAKNQYGSLEPRANPAFSKLKMLDKTSTLALCEWRLLLAATFLTDELDMFAVMFGKPETLDFEIFEALESTAINEM